MSSLLEQAIIDATALKEAALKNAEAVRQTAIENAKLSLEETFTPQIKSFNILSLQEYKKNSAFWLDNIVKHNYSNITWQISVLEKLCRAFLNKEITNTEHLHPYESDVFLVDIYAERNNG